MKCEQCKRRYAIKNGRLCWECRDKVLRGVKPKHKERPQRLTDLSGDGVSHLGDGGNLR